jgi:hypothetical protein
VTDPDDDRMVALREAVLLAIPVIADGAHALSDAGDLTRARALTHARRALTRAVDRFLTDTQPIDERDLPGGRRP